MEESDTEEALELLARAFCTHDPLEVILGITEAEFIEMTRLDLPQIFQDKLSLVVRHEDTDELIGVTAALDAMTPFTDSSGKISPKFAPVAAIVNQLHDPYLEKIPHIRGHTAYYYMGAVRPDWQGRGIAQIMFKATEELIASRHYKRIFGITTNRGSYAAILKNGFKDIATVAYQDFTFGEEKIFATIQKHPGVTLVEKLL